MADQIRSFAPVRAPLVYALIALLMAILTLGVLGVAFAPVANAQESVNVWVFPISLGPEEELYAELNRRFNEEYPDIRVEVSILTWADRTEKVPVAIASGAGPDVLYANPEFLPVYVASGAIVPLNDAIPHDRWETIPSNWLFNASDEIGGSGQYWLWPLLANNSVRVYDKELFAQAGLPTDLPPSHWDDLRQVARTLSRDVDGDGINDYFGIGLQRQNPWEYVPFILQAGGNLLSDDMTRAAFHEAPGLEALELWTEFFEHQYTPELFFVDLAYGSTQFLAGRLGINPTSMGYLPGLENNYRGQRELGLMPVLQNKRQVEFGSIAGFSVLSGAQNVDAALKWVEFISRPEINAYILSWWGEHGVLFVPPAAEARSIIIQEFADRYPLWVESTEQINLGDPFQMHPQWYELAMDLISAVESAINGEKAPGAALSEAAAVVNGKLQAQ